MTPEAPRTWDRPPLSRPPHLHPREFLEAERAQVARQPGLGVVGGLVFVLPLTVLLAAGAGGSENSVLVLGPLTTFALPAVAMIAFWWEDWPGTRLRAAWSGWANTVLVVAGAVALTLLGQVITARTDPASIFLPNPGPGHAVTYPATMPLAGAAFVVMLQLTLVCEKWPLERAGRTWSGLAALAASWLAGIALAWLVVRVAGPGGPQRTHGGLMRGPDFGALLVTIGAWQSVLYVALRGWPLNLVERRAPRLVIANVSVLGAAALTFTAARLTVVDAATISAAAGCVIAAAVLTGMLFEGWPPTAGPWRTLPCVAAVSVLLYLVLTAIASTMTWGRASAPDWVSYTALNAIGLPVILHVGIGRRWPLVRTEPDTPRPGVSTGGKEPS